MTVLSDLMKRILASIEQHGRSSWKGFLAMYPHETEEDMRAALYELKGLGWLRITMKNINTGPDKRKKVERNISRTKKQLYTEQELF